MAKAPRVKEELNSSPSSELRAASALWSTPDPSPLRVKSEPAKKVVVKRESTCAPSSSSHCEDLPLGAVFSPGKVKVEKEAPAASKPRTLQADFIA